MLHLISDHLGSLSDPLSDPEGPDPEGLQILRVQIRMGQIQRVQILRVQIRMTSNPTTSDPEILQIGGHQIWDTQNPADQILRMMKLA